MDLKLRWFVGLFSKSKFGCFIRVLVNIIFFCWLFESLIIFLVVLWIFSLDKIVLIFVL